MPRKPKLRVDYPKHTAIIGDNFDEASSNDKVNYICETCSQEVVSKKRLIAARLLKNNKLLCTVCKNTLNRNSK